MKGLPAAGEGGAAAGGAACPEEGASELQPTGFELKGAVLFDAALTL